jgi:hypothetical protein
MRDAEALKHSGCAALDLVRLQPTVLQPESDILAHDQAG